MSDFLDFFDRLLHGRGEHLVWDRMPDSQFGDGKPVPPLKANESYIVVRLAEMFLRDQRVLWKKFYPMVHGFTRHGKREFAEVAGPGQLKELGTANLERLVGLAYPLTEPIVYTGVDIDILVGLYAVPGHDAAKILLGSLGELSSLVGVNAEVGLKITGVIKTGVESLLKIDGNTLQLGARDTMVPEAATPAGKVARAGYLLAVNAKRVDFNRLWVKDGRLLQGANPVSAKPYDEHDYMLVQIEARATREDWRRLSEVSTHEKAFDEILRTATDPEQAKTQIKAIWPKFVFDVRASENLTMPDKDRVIASVGAGLREKAKEIGGPGPFETRSAAIRKLGAEPRKGFDLLAVEDAFAGRDAAAVASLRANADKLAF